MILLIRSTMRTSPDDGALTSLVTGAGVSGCCKSPGPRYESTEVLGDDAIDVTVVSGLGATVPMFPSSALATVAFDSDLVNSARDCGMVALASIADCGRGVMRGTGVLPLASQLPESSPLVGIGTGAIISAISEPVLVDAASKPGVFGSAVHVPDLIDPAEDGR